MSAPRTDNPTEGPAGNPAGTATRPAEHRHPHGTAAGR